MTTSVKDYVTYDTDVLVVGSEGAGARAAIEVTDRGSTVILATKGRVGRTGATMTAGADFTADGKSLKDYCGLTGDDRDSPEKFFEEIVTEGLFLNNQELVETYVEGAPIALKDMLDWGMKIFGVESAHFQEMVRGVRTNGPLIARTLRNVVKKRTIRVLEDTMVLDLLTDGNRVVGAFGLDMNTGEFVAFKARAVILATGGWQRAWSFTSAPYELTGDGQAMAYRAGAEMIDMEMIQFIPWVILGPPRFKGHIHIYHLYAQLDEGSLVNSSGERFMERYDPDRLEHTSKEILSLGILSEVAAGRGSPSGGAWVSFKGADRDRIKEISEKSIRMGRWFEIATEDWVQKVMNGEDLEIGAAAHYMIGGIRVNGKIETNIPGLYAAGECNGNLWGATRVASAISEVILEGRRAAISAVEYARGSADARIDWEQVGSIREKLLRPLEQKNGRSPIEMRRRIQRIADENVNMLREGEKLQSALEELEEMRGEIAGDVAVQGSRTRRYNLEWIEALQLENLRQCLELTAASALHRRESRGAHFRSDYQQCDNDNWLKNTVIRLEAGKRNVSSEPLVITKLQPPGGVMTYREALGMELASIKGKKEEK